LPIATFLAEWDPRRGLVIIGMYPPTANIDQDQLINIFGSLLLKEEERREGFYEISVGGLNTVAYYSGQELNQIFGIVLEPEEESGPYRGGLVRVATKIFKLGEGIIETEEGWEDLWKWITAYPNFTLEQRVAEVFRDEEAQRLLDILADTGIMTIDEVVDRMKLQFPGLLRDVILTYVHTFEALDIVATKFDEKALIERVYFLRDIFFHRRRPDLFEDILAEIPEYEDKWNEFVTKYYEGGWEKDREILPPLLGNPDTYEIIKEFRDRGIIPADEVSSRGWDKLIGDMIEHQIIDVSGDKYYLFSDPAVTRVFPRYTISAVVARLREGALDKEVVLDYLNTMKNAYST